MVKGLLFFLLSLQQKSRKVFAGYVQRAINKRVFVKSCWLNLTNNLNISFIVKLLIHGLIVNSEEKNILPLTFVGDYIFVLLNGSFHYLYCTVVIPIVMGILEETNELHYAIRQMFELSSAVCTVKTAGNKTFGYNETFCCDIKV